MKARFARAIWSKSLAGLGLSLLLGCGQATNQDVSDQYAKRGLHHIDSADPVLASGVVLDSQEIQRAQNINRAALG